MVCASLQLHASGSSHAVITLTMDRRTFVSILSSLRQANLSIVRIPRGICQDPSVRLRISLRDLNVLWQAVCQTMLHPLQTFLFDPRLLKFNFIKLPTELGLLLARFSRKRELHLLSLSCRSLSNVLGNFFVKQHAVDLFQPAHPSAISIAMRSQFLDLIMWRRSSSFFSIKSLTIWFSRLPR